MKKSCVAACPVEWPDGRGISGRMRVEWVAGSAWNRWSDAHGMGGQMTVESAPKAERNGGNGRYEIHHIEHIQHGGAVYDIDNLSVASPKRHVEIHKEDRQKL